VKEIVGLEFSAVSGRDMHDGYFIAGHHVLFFFSRATDKGVTVASNILEMQVPA
jgi:hypothetical protein